jgi:hypothetical protein
MVKVFKKILFVSTLLFPLVSFANGLVPCGDGTPCTLCHFFVLFKNIVDFLLLPPTGVVYLVGFLMFVVAGMLYLVAYVVSPDDPKLTAQANKAMTSVVIGLVIALGAWVFVNTFMLFIGVADWTGLKEGWFKIDCPVP